ncbi:MAG TPA: hypothetical protein VFT37_08345 [Telluria sp.]|nr:hypothetical protein [Telluria sp.]
MTKFPPLIVSLCAFALMASACTTSPAPAPGEQAVTVVNRLHWTNPVDGKRDGSRTAWPLHTLATSHTERFPLAQVKECRNGACSWGVVKAVRTISKAQGDPSGVTLALDVAVRVARRQQADTGGEQGAMAIPSDVEALQSERTVQQQVRLEYGKVTRFAFEHGIAYDLCAQRIDAAGKPLEACPVAFD